VVRPHVDPARVAGHVVDPIGRNPAEPRDHEVIDTDNLWVALRAPLPPGVLEIADQLLLLGVHRDDRLAGLQGSPDLAVDVLELGVAVGVALPLDRLAVGLEAVPRLVE
jgi:hypothetical protein